MRQLGKHRRNANHPIIHPWYPARSRDRQVDSHHHGQTSVLVASVDSGGGNGAGEGNRTLVSGLGSRSSTIELRPQ